MKLPSVAMVMCCLLCGINTYTFAQQTSVLDTPQRTYMQASDLYSKAKYGSAIPLFDQLAEPTGALAPQGRFYAALCAIQLMHPDAANRIENFIETYPEHALANDALLELAKLQVADKQYEKALKTFARIDRYELNPAQVDEYIFKSGYAYLKTDNLKKARECFAQLTEKAGKFQVPATYYYAYTAYSDKNYETALKYFDRVATDPTFGEVVKYYSVQILSMQGKYGQVIERSGSLSVTNDAKNAEITRLRADAFFHTNRYPEAIQAYKAYQTAKPGSLSRADAYNYGMCLYASKNYKDAIPYFQTSATNQDSLSQNAFYHLGGCYVAIGEKRFAYNAFLSAYKCKSEPALTEEALFNYAKLAIDLAYNPYNEAVTAVQDFIQKYPASPRLDEAYGYLTNLYMLTHNYKQAKESMQKVKRRNPSMDEAYQRISLFYGMELYNGQQYADAIQSFTGAANTNSNPLLKAEARYWCGEANYQLGEWKAAADQYDKFFTLPGARTSKYANAANYSAGYCALKQKNYDQAARYFQKYIDGNASDTRMLNDARLRLADSRFMLRQPQEALALYQSVASGKSPEAEYALYQAALCAGVLERYEQKNSLLNQLILAFPNGKFVDDALYESGLTLSLLDRDSEALSQYEKLAGNYASSPYVRKSLLKSGLILFNQDKNGPALQKLKQVVSKYPGTDEAREAMGSIKSIYVEMGEIDQYVDFSKQVQQGNVSLPEQDSLTFMAAENQYMNGDCPKATESLKKYNSRFPQGAFKLLAYKYMTDCAARTKDTTTELASLEAILGQPRSAYTLAAAKRSAGLYMGMAKYEKALDNYILLEEMADQPENTADALYGQMICNWNLKKYGLATQAAQKLLALSHAGDNFTSDAHYYQARSAMELGNLELARKEFVETEKAGKNEKAAEAAFELARMQYNDGQYDESEKAVFRISNEYASYDYWVAKSFILLADVYVKKGNAFQAKQTLQSIIENYDGEDLRNVAREKLKLITE